MKIILPLKFLIALLFFSTVAHASVVQDAQNYLNGIKTFTAHFQQKSSTGGEAFGTFYLDRTGGKVGKLKLEYDPPVPVLMVTRGKTLIYFDKELKQTSYLDANNTPAGLLIRPTIDLAKDVVVKNIQEDNDMVHLTLARTAEDADQITLTFQRSPFQLISWSVVDVQGIVTDVYLIDVDTTSPIKSGTFKFVDPNYGQRQ